MDVGRYNEIKGKKAKDDESLVLVQRLAANVYQVVMRRFDPFTTEEVAPEIGQFSREAIEEALATANKQLVTLQASIASIQQLLTDVEALEEARAPRVP